MANGGRIQYTVGFNIDQSGLNSMKTALAELRKMPLNKFVDIGATRQDFDEVKSMAREVESVLKKSFNSELGSINLTKFNSELSKSGLSLQQIQQTFSKAGATGNAAFRSVATQLANVKIQVKQTNKFLDEMGQTFKNTIKWGASSAVWNTMTNAIQGAFNYAKKLDSSLNDIRIVTGKSADDMERFAVQANKAAKNLGQSTTSYTNASLIYYQQGLEDAEVQARTETTLKAANVTGQSAAEVSEQLTAVWNGYKVNAEEAELYVDKLAAVAATTAADLEELSTGMSKVASAANIMGVDMDQLNAQLATIVSVTRQAPESVGTALKTIYARMGDIEAGIDTETTLGNYTEQMAEMGFNVLDANGQLRDMGEVIEEIGGKWTTLSREQQVALSQTMAGTRQYNNLLSLFDNWDMYTEALNTSANAAGKLQEQQDTYMEGMEAHLQELSTAGDRVYNSLFNADSLNPLIDGLTFVVDRVGDLIDGLGGGGPALILLGSIVTRVFKKQIGEGISTTIINLKRQKENVEQLRASYQIMSDLQAQASKGTDNATKSIAAMGKEISKLSEQGLISQDDRDELLKYVETAKDLGDEFDKITKKKQDFEKTKTESVSAMLDIGVVSDSGDEDLEKQVGNRWLQNIQNEAQNLLERDKAETLTQEELLEQNDSYKKLISQIDIQRENLSKAKEEASQSYQDLLEQEESLSKARGKNQKKSVKKDLKAQQEKFQADANKLLEQQGDKLEEQTKQNVQAALEAYEKALKRKSGKGVHDAAEAFRDAYIEAIKEVEERLSGVEDAARDIASGTAYELRQEEEENKKAQEDNQQNFNNQLEEINLQSTVQTLTDMVGAVAQVGMALFSLKSMFDVLNNIDLTFEEKISQVFMTLVTIIPTLLMALPALKTGIIALAGALKITTVTAETGFISATGAVLGFQTAMGPLGWVLLGITAAIAGLIAIIHFATEAYNADAIAAKKATEAAKLAGEAATETANAYKTLADTMQGYDDAVNGLKELTKGTQEYQDALESANEKAIELISSNAELAQHVTRNADGLLVFNENAKEEVLETARKRANMAQASSYLAQAQAGMAQNKSERTDLRRDIYYYESTGDGAQKFTLPETQMDKLMSAFEEKDGGLTEEELKNIEGLNERFIPLIKENMEAFVNLTNETKALNTTNEVLKDEILRASLENNAIYTDSTEAEKNAIATLYGEGITLEEDSAEYKALLDKAEKEYADQWGDDSVAQKEYAKARGWTHVSDGWGEGTYIDEEGNEQKVSDEAARTYLKQQYVTDQLANYDKTGLEDITEMVKDISFASRNLDSSTQNEILGVLTGDTDFDTTNLDKEDFDKLSNMLKNGTLESMFSEVDFSSSFEGGVKEFVRRLQEGLENADWSNYFNNLVNSAKKSLEVLDSAIDEMSEGNELDDKIIKTLEEKYPELSRIWDKTSNEYLEMLKKVQGQEEQNYSQNLDAKGSFEYGEIGAAQEAYAEKMAALANSEMLTIDEAYNKAYDEVAKTAGEVIAAAEKAGAENVAVFMEGSGSQAEETIAYENARRIARQAEEAKAALEAGLEVSEEFKEYMEGDYNAALEEAWVVANALRQELEDTFKNDYEFEISITEDLLTDVDNLIAKAENAQTALASIGEGFIVSAENSEELFDIFPELAHNAKVLADGTIKLDESVTNDLLENEAAIIDGDTQRTAVAIDHRIAELEADKAAAEAKLEELHKTSAATFDVQAFLGESYQDFKSEEVNANALAAQDEVANSAASAQAVIANWQAKMEAAKQYAIIAQQAEAPGHNVTASSDVQSYVNSTVSTVNTQNETQMTDEEREKKQQDVEALNQTLYDLTEDYLKNKIASDERMIADLTIAKSNLYTDLSEIGGTGEVAVKDPDAIEYLEDERDIYHDINIELDLLANKLDLIAEEQEKLAGKNLIDNLNQQLVILEQQVNKQREKLAMQKQEQKDMQAALKMQGVEFYDDGTVANYNEALNTHMAAVNAAITYYNSLSAEAQEAYQDQLDNIKEEYEKFKEDLEYYEQLTLDDIHGLEQEISDAISKQIELKIEAFDIKIQIELDYTELQRDWNDFLKDLNLAESDIFGRTESDLRNLDTLLRDIDTRTKAANETTQDFLEGLDGSEDSRFVVDGVFDEAAAREALLNHYNELQDELLNTKQLINDTQRSYLEAMDQAQEKLDKQIESYEFINDLLNHGLKMTELLGGEDAYEEMAKYYEDMANNYEQQADMLRKEKSMWAEEIERAKQAVADAEAKGDAQAQEIAQEQLDKAVENWRAATQELNDITASAVENLQAQYENSIDLTLQRMADKLTNGKGLDYIAKEWELINDNADRYLDTVNSTYEVQALQSKYMQAINNTDSSYAQKKLNEAMEEELKALREKDKLTQYDIDRANKKYDITLKQIALEEAQQNASSMRLRRDSQGNYSYQFVTDEDAVAKAEQDLLAAQNDLYNFDKDAYEKNLDEAYDAYVQFQEDLKEAAMINDPEERAAREALIREQYEQKINDLTAINETIRSNLQESAFDALAGMYDTNEENFKLMNDDVLADFSTLTLEDMPNLMGQLVEGWNTGIQEMITNFADPEEGFSAQCKVAYEDIKTAQDIYEEGLKELGLTAENIFDQIYDDIGEDIEQTKSLMDTNDELISQLRDDLDKQWDLVANQLAILKNRYADLEEAARKALEAMMAVQNMTYAKDTSSGGENSGDTSDPSSDGPGSTDPSQEDDPGSKGKQGKMPSNDVALGVAAAIWRVGNYAGWDNDPVRKAKLTEKFTSDGRDKIQGLLNRVDNGEQNAINRIWSVKDSDLYKYHYDKFDTGGYTGEWGPGGKLAMLHQKEIVLNARDTENLLSAVNIVRSLGDMVQTLSAALASNLTPAAVPVGGNQGADTIEQNVHITAEFPNVSSSSEIELALRNLTNVASQRAFNTRR